MVEERGHHCRPVAEVVAHRAVGQPGGVLGGAHGEAGGTGPAKELEGCIEESGSRSTSSPFALGRPEDFRATGCMAYATLTAA